MHSALEIVRTLIKRLVGRGSMRSYAQFGEDAIVASVFRNKPGVYVDVGAFHPTLYSNTYALYQKGWRGIAIDPEGTYAPLYSALRPRDTFVTAAVGQQGEGVYTSYADRAYNTLAPMGVSTPATVRGIQPLSQRTVKIRPLADILREHRVDHVDFMSVDVEGLDLMVLKTFDWSMRPTVIAVEDDGFDADAPLQSEVYVFLREKGYQLHGKSGPTLIFKHVPQQ